MIGCDMAVALCRATATGETLFGHNCNLPASEEMRLLREEGRAFAPGERVEVGEQLLPQVRRTWTVLAGRCPGQWGYQHGVNEHGVCAGLTHIRTRRREAAAALTGPQLVRLALERAASARQAVDVVTDLVRRHGQAASADGSGPALLFADGREAFVIEMFAGHWAMQHVSALRAVSEVCQIRQDWDQLSPGLADLAIAQGWWPANGSKLDFAAAVAEDTADHAASLRRWGRATLLLEEHHGRIDLPLLRRLLRDHGDTVEAAWCRHPDTPATARTVSSLVVEIGPDEVPPIAWYSFGPPCLGVYFPLFVMGELPAEFQHGNRRLTPPAGHNRPGQPHPAELRAALTSLQERFHREAREFVAETVELRRRGEAGRLPRLAELFMQHLWECWENLCLEFAPHTDGSPALAADTPLPATRGGRA